MASLVSTGSPAVPYKKHASKDPTKTFAREGAVFWWPHLIILNHQHIYIYIYTRTHTHTHTHIYVYSMEYVYIYILRAQKKDQRIENVAKILTNASQAVPAQLQIFAHAVASPTPLSSTGSSAELVEEVKGSSKLYNGPVRGNRMTSRYIAHVSFR